MTALTLGELRQEVKQLSFRAAAVLNSGAQMRPAHDIVIEFDTVYPFQLARNVYGPAIAAAAFRLRPYAKCFLSFKDQLVFLPPSVPPEAE